VDKEICIRNESCKEISREIFEGEGNVAMVKIEEVPENLKDKCKEAAPSCPLEAIVTEI